MIHSFCWFTIILTSVKSFQISRLNHLPSKLWTMSLSSLSPVLITDSKSTPILEYTSKLLKKAIVNSDNGMSLEGNHLNTISSENYLKLSEASKKKSKYIYIYDESHNPQYINDVAKEADYIFSIPKSIPSQSTQMLTLSKKLVTLITKLTSSDYNPKNNIHLDAGQWSHFISLTYPSIDDALPYLGELLLGIDAIELRVDLLIDQSPASIHRQINLLRSVSDLPIVYTVRSKGQIGKFPDDPSLMFPLLYEGLKAGVEWLDVEACWPQEYITSLCTVTNTKYIKTSCLLGSLHVTTPQTEEQIRTLFQTADLYGHADILKVVTGAANDDDCHRIHTIGSTLNKPYIGVCLGAAGSLSRVLNKRFTPVTHPLMAVAAPGQLSVKQLMEKRIEMNLIQSKQYYLFGTPIKQSLSPSMHNAAYKQLELPHVYNLNEQEDVKAYESLLFGNEISNFGGASVTIPHKESIMPYLDEIRPPADVIGAINTIDVQYIGSNSNTTKKTRLIGYNTDWLGIYNNVLDKLRVTWGSESWDGQVGLVVGAGGTARAAAYAIHNLGLQLYVTNRDVEKGMSVAKQLNGTFIPMGDIASLPITPIVIISTIPLVANFTLSDNMLSVLDQLKYKPIIMDVVYKPARTPLLNQAQHKGYICIQGGSMLYEQGVQQFEIWQGRRAPRPVMKEGVFRDIENLEDDIII